MHNRAFESSHLSPVHWDSRTACLAMCLALLLVTPGGGQTHGSPSLPTLPSGAPVGSREDYDIPSRDPVEEARRLRAFNTARQKAILSDANKLLKLTTELDAEIARANSDSLSPAQLRTLAKIEKLAHSISEKMSCNVWIGMDTLSPFSPQRR